MLDTIGIMLYLLAEDYKASIGPKNMELLGCKKKYKIEISISMLNRNSSIEKFVNIDLENILAKNFFFRPDQVSIESFIKDYLLDENVEQEEQLLLKIDDILKYDIATTIPDSFKYKIIANIPYNITGAIFKKFLTEKNQPETMV